MDRLIRAFTNLVRHVMADVFYAKTYPYSVVSFNRVTQRAALAPLVATLDALTNVPVATPGVLLDLPPGTPVKVSYFGDQPYISGPAMGAIAPLLPGSGSGAINNIDAGYTLIVQTPALVVTAVYFPAGIAGGIAAEEARLAAVNAGNTAFLLHMNGGRILPTSWTIP